MREEEENVGLLLLCASVNSVFSFFSSFSSSFLSFVFLEKNAKYAVADTQHALLLMMMMVAEAKEEERQRAKIFSSLRRKEKDEA